ncbi:MAG: flagellar basal body L-ring protein FlgH [Planctomycetes bacterium]|nr:flagellar basal body L-ring protein FlgH [Planctomycetota bacterium]
MKLSAYILTALALAAAAPGPAAAGSIWVRAAAGGTVPRVYEDDTARRMGDILTIVINERSSIDNDTKRNMDKKSERSVKSSGTVGLGDIPSWWSKQGHNGFAIPNIDATSAASSKFEGNSKVEADRAYTDKITVTVHDVLPNGNLVVLGCRRRNLDGDTQMVCVSGVVRPSDITFANTVTSEQVAEFQMITIVYGEESRFTKPGWLGRILNFLSPW